MPRHTVLGVQNNADDEGCCYAAFDSGDEGKSVVCLGHPTSYDRGALEYDCAARTTPGLLSST
jgi:hypothetical protein